MSFMIVLYPPKLIAAACIYMAFNFSKINIHKMPWWKSYEAKIDIIREIRDQIYELYSWEESSSRQVVPKLSSVKSVVSDPSKQGLDPRHQNHTESKRKRDESRLQVNSEKRLRIDSRTEANEEEKEEGEV
jgi:hypothetical protein